MFMAPLSFAAGTTASGHAALPLVRRVTAWFDAAPSARVCLLRRDRDNHKNAFTFSGEKNR
jgi:hypothetical protein